MATNNEDLGSDIKKPSCIAEEKVLNGPECVQSELLDITRSVQKAIAAMRSDIQDFRVEYSEDITEVKRELHQLLRNKVWISREAA